MEIDLSQPLKISFWIEDGETRIFLMILYERLPNFCFICGLEREKLIAAVANSRALQRTSQWRNLLMKETILEALV